jgi:Endonuclease/Exonuclease/phosphatase family
VSWWLCDPRITALLLNSVSGPILIATVYMPTDYGDVDSLNNYIEACAALTALIAESEAVHTITPVRCGRRVYWCADTLKLEMDKDEFSVCSYNCRSLKSSICEVRKLCNSHDIVLLHEHWLLPNELCTLSDLHSDFYSYGHSAVDIASDILVGRLFGGTAILYKKCISEFVSTVVTHDPRITALIAESEAVHTIVAGDFNCQPGSRFFGHFLQLANECSLLTSDLNRLTNTFTYFSDSGCNASWIDHILCSVGIDSMINSICVPLDYITSDHKPVVMSLSNPLPVTPHCKPLFTNNCHHASMDVGSTHFLLLIIAGIE